MSKVFVSDDLLNAVVYFQPPRFIQIDFSTAFDMVNHHLFSGYWRFCVVYIDTVSIKSRSQHVTVDCYRSKLDNILSEVPQGSVLGPLLFLCTPLSFFSILENKLIGYANDSTLIAAVLYLGVRVTVADSLIRDLVKVSEWCDLWRMNLNSSLTKTMIVSKPRTIHPQSLALTIGGTVLKESDDLVILGATFDSKMTFEKHLHSVSRAASQMLISLRKSWQVFHG